MGADPVITREATIADQKTDTATHTYFHVALPFPVDDFYTYRAAEDIANTIQIGSRVKVPFRNRTITGFVVGRQNTTDIKKLKDILEVLDETSVLSDHHLRLAKWISEYYFSSWGEAISNMLPKIMKRKNQKSAANQNLTPSPLPSPTGRGDAERGKEKAVELNADQEEAFFEIQNAIQAHHFKELFLFGVTGSGKSELYIRAIEKILKLGKGAICLVPEIAITEQLNRFFLHRFGDHLEILHSKLTDGERYRAWCRIQDGRKKIVLGARSAIFAPVKDLGLIIMDEEQEGSYKQDQTPRYHTREVARWRARDLNIVFLTGTATPTLETMHRVKTGEVTLLKLPERFDGRRMPDVKIVDLKQAADIAKKFVILSSQLIESIRQCLASKTSVLIMLNRRGFSTHIQCVECGEVMECPNCAVSLTYHQTDHQLVCHYCNHQKPVPETCGKCKKTLLKFSGIGTEKIESELARIFPAAKIARLDADTTQKRGAHENIIANFRAHKIDILVGTQMIAKGFDFPNVTLVGIVNADTGLILPDYRASERTFQLITQMAGRTGRGTQSGKVLIQTFMPNHYSIQCAAKHDYEAFFEDEIARRKQLNYPPWTSFINVMFRGKFEKPVSEQANELRKIIEDQNPNRAFEIIGPAPLPFYRLRGHFRWHMMLRADNLDLIRNVLKKAIPKMRSKKGVFSAVDVQPVSIL